MSRTDSIFTAVIPLSYLRQLAGSVLSRRRRLLKRTYVLTSTHLGRQVFVDIYRPTLPPWRLLSLVIFNDGQDLEAMNLEDQLRKLYKQKAISPMLVVGVHANDRMREYGTSSKLDYQGRGDMAIAYQKFIIEELVPWLEDRNNVYHGPEKRAIAGFSLGGLSAFDLAWRHPRQFRVAGVFSGSLWWRSKKFDATKPDANLIVHDYVKRSKKPVHNRFWFMAGTEDEKDDRNNNGIIDSIDDTLQLMTLLAAKGYEPEKHMTFVEVEGGRHEPETWGKVIGDFLRWI